MNKENQNNPNSQNNQNPQNNLNNQPHQPLQPSPTPFLPNHGHYRNLRVYKLTEIIYDTTFYFTQRYLQKGDRTVDQMIQAARSGKQNIAEGNQAATTSSETEIKLTNVAKASLEELLIDYEDYLRVHGLEQWQQNNPRMEKLRQYTRTKRFLEEYPTLFDKMNEEEICNLSITLIHQAMYMLHRLLETMQRRFVSEGGIKEQMLSARLNYRNQQKRKNNNQ